MCSSSPNRLRDHTGEDQHVSVQRPKGGRQSQAQCIGRYARYHTHASLKIIDAKLAVHLFLCQSSTVKNGAAGYQAKVN